MVKNILFAIMTAWMLSSCSNVEEKPLVISTDVWIGASPLYYAHAMGWLKEANIQMLQAKSIDENMKFFSSRASDAVTGTEHEYQRLKRTHPDLVPVIVYDRSYGGDLILSNRTVPQLKAAAHTIHVYVELDTVGEDMLNYFCMEHNLTRDRMTIFSRKQSEIENLDTSPSSPPTLVITYNPHDLILKKRGFQEVASSKSDAYIVVDSVYATADQFSKHEAQLRKLKIALDRAIDVHRKNPKAFYKVVKPYIENPSYEEFNGMLGNIRWLNNRNMSPIMMKKMEESGFPTEYLIDFQSERR